MAETRQDLVRKILVHRSMSAHFVLAQDRAEKLIAEGQTDAALIEVAGMRDAASAMERRIAIAAADKLLSMGAPERRRVMP